MIWPDYVRAVMMQFVFSEKIRGFAESTRPRDRNETFSYNTAGTLSWQKSVAFVLKSCETRTGNGLRVTATLTSLVGERPRNTMNRINPTANTAVTMGWAYYLSRKGLDRGQRFGENSFPRPLIPRGRIWRVTDPGQLQAATLRLCRTFASELMTTGTL